jgi:hypothetical protein
MMTFSSVIDSNLEPTKHPTMNTHEMESREYGNKFASFLYQANPLEEGCWPQHPNTPSVFQSPHSVSCD